MNVRTFKTLSVTALATGLLLGGARVSQAQINFIDTQIGITTTSTPAGAGSDVTSITDTGNNITVVYNNPSTGSENYVIQSAGTTDAASRDGSGAGAFIRLSNATTGILETSFQTAVLNTSNVNYTFDIAIQDQASGLSKTVLLPFTLTSAFNEGSNGGDGVFTFSNPASTQIGNNIYSFSAFAFVPSSAPPNSGGTSATSGAFSLRVQATPVAVPEPGTVAMLMGMGISGSAFFLRRRKAAK